MLGGSGLSLAHLPCAFADVAQDRQPTQTGDNLARKLDPLPDKSEVLGRQPVTLPPGRGRLATRPTPTGSCEIGKTIGMTDVTSFAATAAVPAVTMTSTLSRTNSATISEKRSGRPSA